MRYLVAYDISDDRVREKVAKLLFKFGIRVQLSCFEVECRERELKDLVERVKGLIDLGTDSLIVYPLTENTLKEEIEISGSREWNFSL